MATAEAGADDDPRADAGLQPVTECYRKLFSLLVTNHFTRALVLCTPTFHVREDRIGIKWKAAEYFIWAIGGSAFAEVTGIGAVTMEQPEQLGWTLFRVPGLGNGDVAPVNACYLGEGQDGLFLSRKSMARWVLEEIEARKWVGKAPHISNSGLVSSLVGLLHRP